MAPQDLVGKADALAADEDSWARDEPHPALALQFAAEGARRLVPLAFTALPFASKDHD
jgi:hypothetical protein